MGFELRDRKLGYGAHTVLENLDINIQSGETVAIIGKSGAGKSTLLLALRELLAQQVAWCPQQPGLVPTLSVHHNIYMGQLEQHHFLINLWRLLRPGTIVKQDIQAICQILQIQEHQFTPCQKLSGGQLQRASIGRALYSKKEILLGDEPISALDEFHAHQTLQLLCEHFTTLVVSLHDVDLALNCCQRIIALKAGKILFDKSSSNVSKSDIHQVYN